MSPALRRIHRCLLLCGILAAVASPAAAAAKISVRPKVFVDGHPAANALVSLYNCRTGALQAGPIAVAPDGSVDLAGIDPGDHCLRAEMARSFATKEIQLAAGTPDPRIDLVPITPGLSTADRAIPIALCLFTFLMVTYPIARYLGTTWAFRREYLIGQLSGTSMKLYYEQFRAGARIGGKDVGDPAIPLDDYTLTFRSDFDRWYGRHYYILPIIGLAVLTAVCGWWGCVSLWDWASGARSLESLRALVATSLAGAFVWIISDEIDRLRRRDFTSFDVYYYVFRILIAVPFGWALTRLELPLQAGIPISFFLGAFPTSSLFTAARRLVNQRLRLGEDPASGNLELEKLQSVGKDIAERFRDEGIYTITQLAYADPLDLTIRTNFDFNYVVDCISQSLLWIYLGENVKDLQPYSLRGAQEVAYFYSRLTAPAPDANAIAALEEIATVRLKMAKEAVQCTMEQVAKDPYTEFLCNIWS